jgi:gliding motility-associated-like protein
MPAGAKAVWSNGSNDPSINIIDTGTYWISVCQDTDTIHITREICDCALYIPSAFTPNGDGTNDIFRIKTDPDCSVQQFAMNIYDRWGKLVFRTNSVSSGWDGNMQGVPVETGIYMYEIQAKSGTKAQPERYKGDITLIR